MTSAWIGNWYERIKQRAYERGFTTVTEFVENQPTASLLELADQLGKEDVAGVQLEKVLIDEAEDTGTMERCVKSLLVRALHEELPEGWQTRWDGSPGGTGMRLISASTSVYSALPLHYRPMFDALDEAIWDEPIPDGWLPTGPDDPILVEIFRKHWREPEQQTPKE
jgi:hypothetical protein